MDDKPYIIALIPGNMAVTRSILRGVHRRVREQGTFRVDHIMAIDRIHERGLLPDTRGLVGHIAHPGLAQQVLELGLPAVTTSALRLDLPLPRVSTDDQAVGRMAAEHFLGRGFSHFAWLGIGDHGYAQQRLIGYQQALSQAGYPVHAYPQADFINRAATQAQVKQFETWLGQLPKPVAFFAANDAMATDVHEACVRLKLAMPEEVALLGVDDDDMICELVDPMLSSVRLPGEAIGYQALCLLEQMCAGLAAPKQPLLLPPMGVAARASTDVLAASDPVVRAALAHIQAHLHEVIAVDELAAAAHVSRRRVERLFRQHLGRTPLQEIQRARIDRACELLVTSDLTMSEIAARCGFTNQSRFGQVFRESQGVTPSIYRQQHRVMLHDRVYRLPDVAAAGEGVSRAEGG